MSLAEFITYDSDGDVILAVKCLNLHILQVCYLLPFASLSKLFGGLIRVLNTLQNSNFVESI